MNFYEAVGNEGKINVIITLTVSPINLVIVNTITIPITMTPFHLCPGERTSTQPFRE